MAETGFLMNPYDLSVANKIINGKQLTICWHVDDLFLGHKDPTVVTNFLNWLAKHYDTNIKKLNVTQGPTHDYLSMNLDFSNKGEVRIDMIPYIKKSSMPSLRRLRGCNLHPLVIASFRFILLLRQNIFLKNSKKIQVQPISLR